MSFNSQLGLGSLSFAAFTTGPFQFLVPTSLGVSSALELDGATIALAPGTAQDTVVADYFRTNNMAYEPVPAVSVEEAESLFLSGAADVLVVPEALIDNSRLLRLLSTLDIEALPEEIAGASGPVDSDPADPDPVEPDPADPDPVEPTDPVPPRTPVAGGDEVYTFAFGAPASLVGAKLVPFGSATAGDIEALGAFPIPMAASEWYAALLTGVIDGVVAIGEADRASLRAILPDDVSVFDGAGAVLEPDPVAQGTSGNDMLVGSAAADDLNGRGGNDAIAGKGGGDMLKGGAGRDKLSGGGGADMILGGGGGDRLSGGGGRDTIDGGGGKDRLDGGKGNDVLTGGKGADLFLFNFENGRNRDTITDFNVRQDTIRVEDLDYRLRIDDGDAVLKFGGGQVLTVEGVTARKALKKAIETQAEPPEADSDPFLIYDLGGKFDRSFNQAAFEGAERWAAKTGDTYGDFEIQTEALRERVLEQVALGSSPVVVTGFGFVDALDTQAAANPDTEFAIIDAIVDQPNVTSYTFAEHEGAYLMGMFAAMASDSDVIGFVGGMDIPLVRRYSTAFEAGAEAIDADINVIINMTGTTPVAWNDPVKGSELANAQIAQGADVIYAVAGGTGLGVLQAVADADILGIGTDVDQGYLHPGNILTSMLKRVDVVVEDVFDLGANLPGGVRELGLAEGAISYVFDDANRDLLTPDMRAAVDAAIADIIAGDIVVPDYLDALL